MRNSLVFDNTGEIKEHRKRQEISRKSAQYLLETGIHFYESLLIVTLQNHHNSEMQNSVPGSESCGCVLVLGVHITIKLQNSTVLNMEYRYLQASSYSGG
jgi:hypothetical protein